MVVVKIHEAKTHLSRLLGQVEQGAEFIIARGDKPVARLVPVESRKVERKPGSLKGKIWMADDFDAPLPEHLQAAFTGQESP